jgi:hypothetical protein
MKLDLYRCVSSVRVKQGHPTMMTFFAVIGAAGLLLVVAAIVAGCVMQYFDDDPDWLL